MTTLEMDGIFTEKDKIGLDYVVFQCRACRRWTKHKYIELKPNFIPCNGCGEIDYDRSSIKSLRTYNELTDNKRKPKK